MTEKNISHIAHRLQQAKENKEPRAIVFIGAGCSVSAGIPRASEIVDYILEEFKSSPDVKALPTEPKPEYAKLMNCLSPKERKRLFKHYVSSAKINVSHIYLAHLLEQGYVDYIVTTNFDNLTLRALALYNNFPPVYDISILRDMTTTSLDTSSVTFLHGQHNGLWQLNTPDEMAKVHEDGVLKDIFTKITNNRTWLVIGYSGDDFIFDQLVKLGRFDNGLFWVGYKDYEPSGRVQDKLLNMPNTESFWIKGYDADSFFIKLNAVLKERQPLIFEKPFSFLAQTLENIKEIEDSEIYVAARERLEKSKLLVKDAIEQYENSSSDKTPMTEAEIEHAQLINQLIDVLFSEEYEKIVTLEDKVFADRDMESMQLLAGIYNNWGIYLGKLAEAKANDIAVAFYKEELEKYKKAVTIKPDYYEAWSNWGNSLGSLADRETGDAAKALYMDAFEKYSKAVNIKPDYLQAWYHWGNELSNLAAIQTGDAVATLYRESITKFARALEIQPDFYPAWNHWGIALSKLAAIENGDAAATLYHESITKFAHAVGIKPDYPEALTNWGNSLAYLAASETGYKGAVLYQQAFEKYARAVEIKPDFHQSWCIWGIQLATQAASKSGEAAEMLYQESIKKLIHTVEIQPENYEAWNQWGVNLCMLAANKKAGEAKVLYQSAFEKFERAVNIRLGNSQAWNNWASSLIRLIKIVTGKVSETLYEQALYVCNRAIENGGSSYNLACLYAITNQPDKAFDVLETCLAKNEIDFEHVEKDDDWGSLRNEPQYISLNEKYQKKE
jgi:tetratricopeptide (TPR) repeat protein